MTNLRKLTLLTILISILSVPALAGETSSPPCASPDPGETSSPPCSVAQDVSDGNTAPGQANTLSSVAISEEYSAELAIEIARYWLSIY